ncbi:ABC transporter substrate-binding protein [Vibrio sp. JC009]|uniref:ABC transporter substrate-binding protein n=1 Tax=Vibrio sp. JC009 TaxID=2912314 RepID=UPI0023AFD9A8|nr:ABC transporter substrate-binding protein [Vibrio sp. JC009]WED23914.1 ABC transporter substrate-binding protein [Vibrio sp. JC009]
MHKIKSISARISGTVLAAAIALGSGHATAEQTVVLKDQNGDSVKVSQNIERVGIVWPVVASVVVSLDQGTDRLVAIPQQIKKTMSTGMIGELFPEIRQVSSKAVDNKRVVSVEKMLQLNPDIVFEEASKTKSIKGMRNAGIPAFGLKMAKTDLDKKLVTALGTTLGKTERAEELLEWRKASFNKVISKTEKISKKEQPDFVYLWHKQRLIGPSHHMTSLLKKAGAKNAIQKKQNFVGYDSEMLLKLDPDFIFLHNIGTKKVPADFYNDPVFADLKAVKNRTIYKIPTGVGVSWDGPSLERALALEWFTRLLHGDDFIEGSMRSTLAKSYPKLYGKPMTDAQINRILIDKINGTSTGYSAIMR